MKNNTKAIKFLLKMFNSCKVVHSVNYPNSIFYIKDDVVIFEKDVESKVFFMDNDDVYEVFDEKFGIETNELHELVKNTLPQLEINEYEIQENYAYLDVDREI